MGDIVNVERVSYDLNGEVWRWKEIAIVTLETTECFHMYTPYHERFELDKKYENEYQILSSIENLTFYKEKKMDKNTKIELNRLREEMNFFHLSDQALGAVMMALQNSLLHQTDIVPVLKALKFVHHPSDGLVVTNPPILRTNTGDGDA